MTVYKIVCEWDMPIATGKFLKSEDAWEAINKDDWEGLCDMTLEEVLEDNLVYVEEVEIK